MNARAMSTLIRGDRLTVVAQALVALRRRTWATRSRLDLETLEAACAVCEDRIVELESDKEDQRRALEEMRARLRERIKQCDDLWAERDQACGEQEGQRSAFLSQIADLERRLAENLASKLELCAENERLRHGQQAVAELVDAITAALAAKAAPRARRK